MSENEGRSWNRFNSDFKLPENDEASRVAYEVKASMDSWIQSNLSRLEAEMTQRLDGQLAELTNHISASRDTLKSVGQKIADIGTSVDGLVSADPQLGQQITVLKAQTKAARDAMQKAAEEWENHGKEALATVMKIAGTVATIA